MYRYFFSLFLFISVIGSGFSQTAQVADTTNYKEKFGLRVGIDLSKPLRTILEDDYSGIELLGDYRIYKDYYLAAELGNEKITFDSENILTTTSGSYIKLGGDYNAYDNWENMQNSIFVGVRYGFATFSQTLEGYRIYSRSSYFGPDYRTDAVEEKGLTANWLEVIAGIKVELFNNFFLSANVQLKRLIGESTPRNFDNLAIPGFGRTYDAGQFGAGYSYAISYLVPIFKKDKD
ncbi:DUF6048 family protein [Gramella sp. AN32]|uniref:DUF6048 family protein n=1 Tax=Christiangramia antarctica TaxID=2058158 RepID=A0ABW5X6C2_9FLAO|nr:DUF6048 family protein [Gramella sp. AN32]MCM4157994.1 hypothetical protein [Gramella sp. AN32]